MGGIGTSNFNHKNLVGKACTYGRSWKKQQMLSPTELINKNVKMSKKTRNQRLSGP
jgi:CxxC motif-containing protein